MPVIEALRGHKNSIRNVRSIGGVQLVPSYEPNIAGKTSYAREKYGEYARAQMRNLSGEGRGPGNFPIWASFANYNENAPLLDVSSIDKKFFTVVKNLMQEHTGPQPLTTRDKPLVESFDFRNAIIKTARHIGEEDPLRDDSVKLPKADHSVVPSLKVQTGHDGRYRFQQQLIDLVLIPEEQRTDKDRKDLDRLVGQTLLHMKTITAREKATSKLRKEIGEIADYVHTKDDIIDKSPEGLFTLNAADREPRLVTLDAIDMNQYSISQNLDVTDLSFSLPSDRHELSVEQQAEIVTNYLTQLTRRHTPDSDLSDKFLQANRDKISEQLRDGTPLHFSVYISLSKFTNPFNTKSSVPDIGELQRGIELTAFIASIESVTGKKPEVTIMNEFPIFEPYTNSTGDAYQRNFEDILDGLGIDEQVHIQPFGRQTFVDFLTRKNIPEVTALNFTNQTVRLLTQIYYAIGRDQIPRESMREYITGALENVNTQMVPHDEYLDTVVAHCRENYKAICTEYSQTIRAYFKGNTDLSLLYPDMSQSLLYSVFERDNPAETDSVDEPSVVRHMHSQVTEHAKLEGITFKAFMRMRSLFKEIFDEPIIDEKYIPLSITSAKDKWSVSLGRTSDTAVVINDEQQQGVNPQNGIGVLVDNQIVSFPYITVVENPDLFSPITIHVGETILEGYQYNSPAIPDDAFGLEEARA